MANDLYEDFCTVAGKLKKVGRTALVLGIFVFLLSVVLLCFMFLHIDRDIAYFQDLYTFTFHPFPQGMVFLLEIPNGLMYGSKPWGTAEKWWSPHSWKMCGQSTDRLVVVPDYLEGLF